MDDRYAGWCDGRESRDEEVLELQTKLAAAESKVASMKKVTEAAQYVFNNWYYGTERTGRDVSDDLETLGNAIGNAIADTPDLAVQDTLTLTPKETEHGSE